MNTEGTQGTVPCVLSGSLADLNPLRYRGYYYDSETGFYYLQSRYYDPALGRFLNADGYASTGQGFIGYNMFAYCGNNPVNSTDPSGSRPIWDRMCEGGSIGYTDSDSEPSHAVVYGVPYYNQGNSELCWAFCQTMIEDYENKTMRSNDEATARAVEIAKSRVSPGKKWNVGGWPGNYDKDKEIRIFHSQEVFSVLLIALKNGPAYAFYCNGIPGTTTHLVVVTGLDISNGLVYTNDPLNSTGRASVQSIDEFFRGSASAGAGSGKPLYWIAPIY